MKRLRYAATWCIAPLVLLLLNVWIAVRLFHVEWSANLGSNEGEFIAIARGVARHGGDWKWWPEWGLGLPFQNTYLPLLQVVAGIFSRIAGHSAALAFHQVSAAFFCAGPVFVYLMACGMTRMPWASFLAATAYSAFSPCALLPTFRVDLGSIWNLRRLQILAFYGEGPHTACLAFVPLAILFLYLAIERGGWWNRILAGVFLGAAVLANAFAATILAVAAAALLASVRTERFWRNAAVVGAIAALSYCWISPFLPPSVVSAIRMNSPTVEGDYRFSARMATGWAITAAGFALVWWAMRRRAPGHLRLFALFAWPMTAIVTLDALTRIYVVPQPHRYQIAMDLSLCLLAVFGGAEILRRISPRALTLGALALALALGVQARHAIRYGRGLVRSTDITKSDMYREARWMDANLHGARAMVGGSYSFYFNDFSDAPQLHGGQDPMLPNFMLRIAVFTIYSGMNAGARDGQVATLWLKALGAHAVSVPGPDSQEMYKPFANPRKFDGILPVLWREGGDTVYGVPARSDSLAHVMAAGDLVRDPPVNGLDTAELEKYVAALENPAYPEATWRWTSRHSAVVDADVAPGQEISTQVTYAPGWRATGAQAFPDGLGLMALKPAGNGPCEIMLTYDGGAEWRVTCCLSGAAMFAAACLVVLRKRRKARDFDGDGRKLAS
jgi:hypothetical protein